jgi:plastocyanin
MSARRLVIPALGLLAFLSCFSDRSSITLPTGGECTIPATAFGRNRVAVIIRQFTFLSDTVRVRAGGTVTWVNCEEPGTPDHTTTSGVPGSTTGEWDSGLLAPGTSFAHTFASAGTFLYFCRPHPGMRGIVIVE